MIESGMIERRRFITGLISFVAAPGIVRATNLMPVKAMFDPRQTFLDMAYRLANPPILNAEDGIWQINYDYAIGQIVRVMHVPEEYLICRAKP